MTRGPLSCRAAARQFRPLASEDWRVQLDRYDNEANASAQVEDYFAWHTDFWDIGASKHYGESSAGVIMGLLAAVFGIVDLLDEPRIRALAAVWRHATGNVLAVPISIYNFYIRYTVGEAAVRPTGLILSIIVVPILLFTGWKG
ncbi:MAG: DUF2231 domain-containing protein [Rhizomicrobium sp.]